MKSHLLTLTLSFLLILSALSACGGDKSSPSTLLSLLRFVPDTPEYRAWLTYGDADAWHTSWNIPRIDNLDELDNLDRESRAYWMSIMGYQTTPPDTLGYQYLLAEDQCGFYGFGLFNLDRYLLAGNPPDCITIAEFSFDKTQIADALVASGYETEELETGGTLYSIMGDYEIAIDFPTRTGQMGHLNRIALFDRQVVIAKATANVTNALLAHSDKSPSLADNADYVAAAQALQDSALKDTGELLGVIFVESGSQFAGPAGYLGNRASAEPIEELKKQYASQAAPLPTHNLVAFATRHSEGASYLILAVVFPEGTDAAAAADVLADRLQNYTSLMTRGPLDDYWAFEKATGVKAGGLPVALVVMRADDPPPTPEDAERVNAAVWSWIRMVTRRDLAFLLTE